MAKHTKEPATPGSGVSPKADRIDGKSSNQQKHSIQMTTNIALQIESAKIEFKVI
jgi:hypothetical protein